MSSQTTKKPPSSSSSHRLPTVSASQALQKLIASGPRTIPTSLKSLDQLLAGRGTFIGDSNGGIERGQVIEVYGPSGAGKTTFCMQVAASALHAGDHVVWIDASYHLVKKRFQEILAHAKAAANGSTPNVHPADEPLHRFHHFTAPTLSHLLALFIRAPPAFPPPQTSVIIVDSLSTLVDNAYPRHTSEQKITSDAGKWATGRKYAILSDLVASFGKAAAIHNLAVVMTSQTMTRVRSGSGAILLPAIPAKEWDNGIATRLVMFRDFAPDTEVTDEDKDRLARIRIVGVTKIGGVNVAEDGGVGSVVPLTIETTGLKALDIGPPTLTVPQPSPVRTLKRTYDEIADSDDDAGSDAEYGWGDDDTLAAEGLIADTDLGDPIVHSHTAPETSQET